LQAVGVRSIVENGGRILVNNVENMWKECSGALRLFILKRVPDEAIAEDILQEVFVKIQSQIETLRDVRSSRQWLYAISRNTIVDYYRTRKDTVELPESLASEDETVDDGVVEELTPCVKSMVDRLPEKYREAVVLTAYEGLTQKEMGKELGISVSGAKSRVQRAREHLKNMLLDCCHFELDRLGKVISYESKRPRSCDC
jgi:RNA polymerase sigma-70 factor, ECF subfamily